MIINNRKKQIVPLILEAATTIITNNHGVKFYEKFEVYVLTLLQQHSITVNLEIGQDLYKANA